MQNVKDFGARGDGTTDDTAAIQAAFDVLSLSPQDKGQKSGIIYFPTTQITGSQYLIRKPIRYRGSAKSAIRIVGDVVGHGEIGSQILWNGATVILAPIGAVVRTNNIVTVTYNAHPFEVGDTIVMTATEGNQLYAGQKTVTSVTANTFSFDDTGVDYTSQAEHTFGYAMFQMVRASSISFEYLHVDGNGKALYNIWIEESSASIFFNRVTSVQPHPQAGVCIALGKPQDAAGTYRTSEGYFDDIIARGGDTGVKILSAGRTKNFHFRGGVFSDANTGIDYIGASVLTVVGAYMDNIKRCFNIGPGRIYLTGVAVTANQPNTRFVTGTTGSNPGSLIMQGCNWYGKAPADDVIINYSGAMTLIGNEFHNERTPTSLPYIVCNGATWQPNETVDRGRAAASIVTLGNFYLNATDRAPIFDGPGGNDLTASIAASGGYARLVPHSVVSFGDIGGDGSGTLNKLRPTMGVAPTYTNLIVDQPATPGITVKNLGQPLQAVQKITIDKAVWKNNALTQDLEIFHLSPKTKVVGIYADTTQAYVWKPE